MKGVFLGLALLSSVFSSAWAFSLGDHDRVTRQAAAELVKCFPGELSPGDVNRLVWSDKLEDLNVLEKWWKYSHYFNPYHPLNMRRFDSSVRVRELERGLSAHWDLGNLGHLIHHIQDMASPPHVVPVKH